MPKVSKLWSCLHVGLLVFTLLLGLWVLAAASVSRLQRQLTQWNYVGHILFFALPAVALGLQRRNLENLGLVTRAWAQVVFRGLAYAFCLTLPLLMAITLGIAQLRPASQRLSIADTIVFQFIFVGLGEELFFRGYIQSTLNEAFGRRWRWGAVHFGPALILTSLIWGVLHVLNPCNPFLGRYGLDWAGLLAIGPGLLLGLIREHTGNIWASVVLHGSCVSFLYFTPSMSLYLSQSVGWFLTWLLFAVSVSGRSRQ